MLLNAQKPLEEQKSAGNLCWTFNIASGDDMQALGRTFAQAVLANGPIIKCGMRIGLDSRTVESYSMRSVGKTTFSKGFLSAIQNKEVIENGFADQNLYRSPVAGFIRHYDTKISIKNWMLPSYKDNKKDFARKTALIDLVEHPHYDRHDTKFHFLFVLRKCDNDNSRQVSFVVTPEMAKLPAVEEFLIESGEWRNTPDSNPYTARPTIMNKGLSL